MRVFRRPSEFRTPEEAPFRPGRVRRGPAEEDESAGFEDRAPTLGFPDVAGLDDVIEDLRDIVGYVTDPTRYEALGAQPPTGILLFGEPGCGKTLLGRALAGEVGVPCYFVSATSFVERFVGLGASRIRELFLTATQDAPCIVFIDELDAIGRQRTDGAGDREFDHTLNQLLVELDGFLGAHGVITIGATNRPDLLDSALVRPGRFDRRIEISRPDRDGREAALRLHARKRPFAAEIDWGKVADTTEGCSPAELAGLVNEAALLAARNQGQAIGWDKVELALDRLLGGGTRSGTATPTELDRRAAHEAGHALAALRLHSAGPNARISLMACGQAPFAPSAWSASARRALSTGPQLTTELIVLMAGRAAEQLLVGSPSTLSENDLSHASALAERIVRTGLCTENTPHTTEGQLNVAEHKANQLVRVEQGMLEALVTSLRSAGSMFIDEVRALTPTERTS